MAVPSAVSKFTVTVCSLAGLNVTSNWAVPPSCTAASPIDSSGVLPPPSSLSLIVPSPVWSSSVAPSGLRRVTVKRSSDSWASSSTVDTEIVFVGCPAVKVSVADVCV